MTWNSCTCSAVTSSPVTIHCGERRIRHTVTLRPVVRVHEHGQTFRGGPATAANLTSHARRTHAAFSLDGQPLWGVSVACALDDIGSASLDGLLRRFASYRAVHLPTVGQLTAAGFDVVTARWRGDELELHNPSARAAQVRIAAERSAQARRGNLVPGWVAKLPLITVPAGETLRWRVNASAPRRQASGV